MNTNKKFIELLNRLIGATKNRKVSWEETIFGDAYQAALPHATIEVGIDRDSERKHQGYYAKLLDENFKVVDRLSCSIGEPAHAIRRLWDEAHTTTIEEDGDLLERLLADVHRLLTEPYLIRATSQEEPLESKFKRLALTLAKATTATKIEWKETIVENVFELPLEHGTIRIAGDPLRRPDRPLYLAVMYPGNRMVASLDPEDPDGQNLLQDLFDRVRLNVFAPRTERILDQALAELK